MVGSEVHKAVSDAGLDVNQLVSDAVWLCLGAGPAGHTSHIASKKATEAVYLHQSLALACQVLTRPSQALEHENKLQKLPIMT